MESTIDINFIKNFITLANKDKTMSVINVKEIKLNNEDTALEIAAVKLKHGKISGEYFDMFITPKKYLPYIKIDSTYRAFYKENCNDYYLNEKDQLAYFLKFIGGHIVIEYNSSDINIINNKLTLYSLNKIEEKERVISLYELLYRYNARYSILDNLNLESVCEFFKILIEKNDIFHSALFHAIQISKIFMHVYNIYKKNADNLNLTFTKKMHINIFNFDEKNEEVKIDFVKVKSEKNEAIDDLALKIENTAICDEKVSIPNQPNNEKITSYDAYISGAFNPIDKLYGYGCSIISGNEKKIIGGCDSNDDFVVSQSVAGIILGVEKVIELGLANNIKTINVFTSLQGIGQYAEGTWKAKALVTKEFYEFYQSRKSQVKVNFYYLKQNNLLSEASLTAKRNVRLL